MKPTIINRKRLVRCMIARNVQVQGGTAGNEYLIRLVGTDEELRGKEIMIEMYDIITSDFEEVLTIDKLKKLMVTLGFKNMSDIALEGLINYCEACACEIVYHSFECCPKRFAYAGKHTLSKCISGYEETAQPRMLKVIKDAEKNVCKIIGCDSFKGEFYREYMK